MYSVYSWTIWNAISTISCSSSWVIYFCSAIVNMAFHCLILLEIDYKTNGWNISLHSLVYWTGFYSYTTGENTKTGLLVIFRCWGKIPKTHKLKERKCTLAHGIWSVRTWLAGLMAERSNLLGTYQMESRARQLYYKRQGYQVLPKWCIHYHLETYRNIQFY